MGVASKRGSQLLGCKRGACATRRWSGWRYGAGHDVEFVSAAVLPPNSDDLQGRIVKLHLPSAPGCRFDLTGRVLLFIHMHRPVNQLTGHMILAWAGECWKRPEFVTIARLHLLLDDAQFSPPEGARHRGVGVISALVTRV